MGATADGLLQQSIGIQTKGGICTKLIPRGSPLPTSHSEKFSTADRDQRSIKVHVFYGDNRFTADNVPLGTFEVQGIGPAEPLMPQIQITFHVDAYEGVRLSALDLNTGKDLPVSQC
jgi:molecular chaperone DnaK